MQSFTFYCYPILIQMISNGPHKPLFFQVEKKGGAPPFPPPLHPPQETGSKLELRENWLSGTPYYDSGRSQLSTPPTLKLLPSVPEEGREPGPDTAQSSQEQSR